MRWIDRIERAVGNLTVSHAVLCLLLVFPVEAWPAGNWVRLSPNQSPSPRMGPALAYDSVRGQVLLFSGYDGWAGNLGDTWIWDGSTWAPRTPATGPSPWDFSFSSHRMAFDSVRGEVVLFGGKYFQSQSQTWTWNGSTWSLRSASSQPPFRESPGLCFDSVRGEVVLFGGDQSQSPMNDTWVWDGSSWTQRFPVTSPPARTGAMMVFDSVRGEVVLFGGLQYLAELQDTWVWDGSNWTQRHPASSPSARAYGAATFDSSTGEVVLFGGGANPGLDDTWTWNGSSWTQQFPAASPPGRNYCGMAYDTVRSQAVLFGGYSFPYGNLYLGDTWIWSHSNGPLITSVKSKSGKPGTVATIRGTGFSKTEKQNTVYFGSKKAQVSKATLSNLKVTIPRVPKGTYAVYVVVNGQRSNTVQFQVK